MSIESFNRYANAINILEANMQDISNVSFPGMEKSKRSKLWSEKKKAATVKNKEEKYLTPEEAASAITRMLNG